MLRAGLEPARITPHAPQTCAATNYATSAISNFQNLTKNYLFEFVFAVFAAVFVVEFAAVLVSVFAGTAEFRFVIGGT